jgi:hypothetical protein
MACPPSGGLSDGSPTSRTLIRFVPARPIPCALGGVPSDRRPQPGARRGPGIRRCGVAARSSRVRAATPNHPTPGKYRGTPLHGLPSPARHRVPPPSTRGEPPSTLRPRAGGMGAPGQRRAESAAKPDIIRPHSRRVGEREGRAAIREPWQGATRFAAWLVRCVQPHEPIARIHHLLDSGAVAANVEPVRSADAPRFAIVPGRHWGYEHPQPTLQSDHQTTIAEQAVPSRSVPYQALHTGGRAGVTPLSLFQHVPTREVCLQLEGRDCMPEPDRRRG